MSASFSNQSSLMLAPLPLAGLLGVSNTTEETTAQAFGLTADDFRLPLLPFDPAALAPFMSAQTIGIHYDKHHQAYVDNLNMLTVGTPLAACPLENIIQKTATMTDKTAVFNNAAQVWNHTFFWQSMKTDGGGHPTGRLLGMIVGSFDTFEAFKNAFVTAGVRLFGSGCVWLVQDGETVKIVKTANADTPVAYGQNALLTCDVWEHAYYLDYQNRRKDYLATFIDRLANWEFAASRLK